MYNPTPIAGTPPRHPEKAHKPSTITPRKPDWLRVRAPVSREYQATRKLVRESRLRTVCEEASCPNIGECWSRGHVTVMVMGDICTRGCAFCNVATGTPGGLDPDEPARVAAAAVQLGLRHIVVTSVDRDDLPDGGAGHFAAIVTSLRHSAPGMTIELLTPDFKGKAGAAELLAEMRPDVLNHNLETVPRLYPTIRPGARYFVSLELLHRVKLLNPEIFTKSGLMVGLGETDQEIAQVMDDLRAADVDFLTIGQYLQPTPKHAPIERFVEPDIFARLAALARGKGFAMVAASPLTRSSYHADADFARLRAIRASSMVSGDRTGNAG